MSGFTEFVSGIDGGDDDGDVFGGDVGGILGDWDGLVGVGSGETDEEPEVAVESVGGGWSAHVVFR